MSLFDFLQREGIIGALVPVARAIHRVKHEACRVGLVLPVRPLVARNALHGDRFGCRGPGGRAAAYPPAEMRNEPLEPVVPNPPRIVPDGLAEVKARALPVNAADWASGFPDALLALADELPKCG